MQITIDRILKPGCIHITITADNECGFENMELEKSLNNKEVIKAISKKYNTDIYTIKERCLDNVSRPILNDIVITKDNIHLYYEFMSDEDLKTNHKILNILFNHRYDKVVKVLNHITKGSDIHVSLTDSFVIEPNGKSFDDENYRAFVGLQAFRVKDTLKPIDEYIADIKASEEYKAFIA